jgi:hypothetical protein
VTDNKLATQDLDRVPDAYERDYMRGEGTVLYRDKTSSWQMTAICAAVAAVAIVKMLLAPALWAEGVIGLAILTVVWLLFSVLRVTVSEGHVNIQLGLFGPKIPISAIESAEAVQYDLKGFGGWGIRRNRAGEWLYNLPGDGRRAVRIAWRTRKGKRRVTYVATRESEQLSATIEQARAALPAGKSMAALPKADDE